MEKTDEYFMRLALKEAEMALSENEIPIGAVIVANGKVIARAQPDRDAPRRDSACGDARHYGRSQPAGGQISLGMHPLCHCRALRDVCGGYRLGTALTHRLWLWRRETGLLALCAPSAASQGHHHCGRAGKRLQGGHARLLQTEAEIDTRKA